MALDISMMDFPKKKQDLSAAPEGSAPEESTESPDEESTEAMSPLADASDDDLIAECQARGLKV